MNELTAITGITTDITKIKAELPHLAALLSKAIEDLALTLSVKQQQNLMLYLDKLLLWNKAYNLTAISNPQEALIKHVLDCLAILAHLPKGDVLDIGTGAGLPAVIIAICQPDRHCTALDSNQKKIRFIRQAAFELKLDNITPVAARIETHRQTYQVVTSRAFASLSDFVALGAPVMQDDGCLFAMKGRAPEADEVARLQAQWQVDVMPISVPNLNEARHVVTLRA